MRTEILRPGQLTTIDGEPHVFDLHLAVNLGFANPRQIRELIARNTFELESYGSLSCGTTNPTMKGGRPGKAYYLNEGQALVICALSRTPKAVEVRKLIIDVFMAWRQGKSVHVQEHYRSAPQRAPAFESTFDMVYSGQTAFISMSMPLKQAMQMTEHYFNLA